MLSTNLPYQILINLFSIKIHLLLFTKFQLQNSVVTRFATWYEPRCYPTKHALYIHIMYIQSLHQAMKLPLWLLRPISSQNLRR